MASTKKRIGFNQPYSYGTNSSTSLSPTSGQGQTMGQPAGSGQMKTRHFMDADLRRTSKGTKPLPDPVTLPEILTKVLVHGCRKILFINPHYRVAAYACLLFLASLIADYMPIPRSYFSRSDNIPNTYFVKFSWAWTFILVGGFMFLTTSVYCCGDRKRILQHFGRLLVGTLVWFVCTNLFSVLEESTGHCLRESTLIMSIRSRRQCVSKDGRWTSFDISGHAFLLIWCVFFISEEAKAIIGWDNIKHFIRIEEHNRTHFTASGTTEYTSDTPLGGLSDEEFGVLKINYEQYNIFAKILIVGMTLLLVLWDVMLVATAVYFHVMIEKVIGGFVAVVMWYFFYRSVYPSNLSISPGLPGSGMFKYGETKLPTSAKAAKDQNKSGGASQSFNSTRYRANKDDIPKFMGMPLYGLRKGAKMTKEDLETEADPDSPTKS